MTYRKYHIEGIILKHFDRGEADRVYLMLTSDLGMIYAKAYGVRKQGAKQSLALQELSLVDVSVVRAKESWRITNVEASDNFLFSSDRHSVVRNIVRLLRYLVRGEEKNEVLYQCVREGFMGLLRRNIRGEDIQHTETLLALRVLHNLGYLGNTKFFGYVVSSPYINDMVLSETKRINGRAIREINRSLNASGM